MLSRDWVILNFVKKLVGVFFIPPILEKERDN